MRVTQDSHDPLCFVVTLPIPDRDFNILYEQASGTLNHMGALGGDENEDGDEIGVLADTMVCGWTLNEFRHSSVGEWLDLHCSDYHLQIDASDAPDATWEVVIFIADASDAALFKLTWV